MKKIQNIVLIITIVISTLLIAIMLIFMKDSPSVVVSSDSVADTPASSLIIDLESDPIPEPIPEETTATLLAVGDNLIHMGVHLTGKQEDGSYDYSFLFETIQPYLDSTDIKIINQETIFGGNDIGSEGYAGYPRFNSRTDIGDAIVEAGFNVVLHSTNHTADQGLDAILHCMDYWETNHPNTMICGIRKEPDIDPPIQTMEVNGITFAFLNYTYGPNLGSFPKQYDGYMDMLCAYDESTRIIDFTSLNPKVIEDIKEADTLADVVVVCPHWGTEYTTTQSTYQENFAKEMTEAGADLIIGTHPHVVQPVSYVESDNGNKSLCYYSLGNYVSTQKQVECMLEGMAIVTFKKQADGNVIIEESETGVIPLVCQYTQGSVRIDNIYFLADYTEELALKHGMYTYAGIPFHAQDMFDLSNKVFGEWAMEPYLKEIVVQ